MGSGTADTPGELDAPEATTGRQAKTIRQRRRAASDTPGLSSELWPTTGVGARSRRILSGRLLKKPPEAGDPAALAGGAGLRGGWGSPNRAARLGGAHRSARAHRAREEGLGSAMGSPSIVGRLAASAGTRRLREGEGVRPWRPARGGMEERLNGVC